MRAREAAMAKLSKAYEAALDDLHAENKLGLEEPLRYFVMSLKYLRDYFIMTEPLQSDGKENTKIATIATAVSEYYKYSTCVRKYYLETQSGLEPLHADRPGADAKGYAKERQQHWDAFWGIVRANVDSWGVKDDLL